MSIAVPVTLFQGRVRTGAMDEKNFDESSSASPSGSVTFEDGPRSICPVLSTLSFVHGRSERHRV